MGARVPIERLEKRDRKKRKREELINWHFKDLMVTRKKGGGGGGNPTVGACYSGYSFS